MLQNLTNIVRLLGDPQSQIDEAVDELVVEVGWLLGFERLLLSGAGFEKLAGD
jgi:hypothetical protein